MRVHDRLITATLLLTFCVVAPVRVRAQSDDGHDGGVVLRNALQVHDLIASRAQRLNSSAGPDPDTVYVGKSYANHTAPDNYWNLYTGTYRPGVNLATNATWDWDNTVGIQAADSLMGWWPVHRQYNSTGGLTLSDDQRPWWALDHGNIANYVISQQSSAKRTFGVVGLWHADAGRNAGSAVSWTPLSGAKSAWCGLRQHGDVSVLDAQTGQAFNQDVVWPLHDATTSGGGSGNNFPGYPDQIDQILYRDIPMLSSQSLTVTFKYRTRMSTSIGTLAATRTGWFHGDPLAVTAGNFISSSFAGANAPQDSFMVYIGRPVDDAACVYSDGTTRAVYDKQRRWFSEVIRVFGVGTRYFEIFQTTGNNPADTLAATPTAGPIVIPAATIGNVLGATNGIVRLVFRVKTNRGFADSDTAHVGVHVGRVRRGAGGRRHHRQGCRPGLDRRLRDRRAGRRQRHRQPLPAAGRLGDNGRMAFHRQAADGVLPYRSAVEPHLQRPVRAGELAGAQLQHRRARARHGQSRRR